MDEKYAFQFNFHKSHANNTKSCRHALIPMKRKTGKNNKSQKDLEYWPFSPAAETLIYMLIGALTTRAKDMSLQSKYQWNEIEWKIHRVFFCGRRRRKNLRRVFFVLPALLLLYLGLCYVQNIKLILYKRVRCRLLIGVFYILSKT